MHNMGGHDMVNVPKGLTPVVNDHGEGYGRFAIDEQQRSFLLNSWTGFKDLERYSAMLTLYENYHLGNLDPGMLFRSLCDGLRREHNDLVASTMCSILGTLMTRLDDAERTDAELQLFEMAQHHSMESVRQALLRQLSSSAVSTQVVNALYGIWSDQNASFFNNRDYMRLAYHLAVMCPEKWDSILDTQRQHRLTADQRREFDFISRACNPDTLVQQQLFNELLQAENRRVEPWARDMLALLNDPTREPHANRYLTAGLDALEEVQRTGDIFFPGYWLSALLAGHKSDEAKRLVRAWIDSHPALEPALMNKLKENAYWLLR